MEMGDLGRSVLLVGLVLAALGGVLMLINRVPWLGRLPGDFVWQWGNTTIYVPLGTMVALSIVLSVAINLIGRLWR